MDDGSTTVNSSVPVATTSPVLTARLDDDAGDRRTDHGVVDLLFGVDEARPRVGELGFSGRHGVPRHVELARRQRACRHQRFRALGLALRHRQLVLRRAYRRRGRAAGVLEVPGLDPSEHRAAAHGLPFFDGDLQHRSAQLRAKDGLALRTQITGHNRARR